MVVGTRQMEVFRADIQSTIETAISRVLQPSVADSQSNSIPERAKGYDLFNRGGKFRYVPMDFEVFYVSGAPLQSIWSVWRLGKLSSTAASAVPLRPYR